MYVPPEFITCLSDRLNIFDVISKYVPLTKKGTRFFGCCPFHQEKTPSFQVNVQKNSYTCYGCKEFGNIFTFIQKFKNVNFVAAIEILALQAGLEVPQGTVEDQSKQMAMQENIKIMQAAQEFFQMQLNSAQGQGARSYLLKREISLDHIENFGLGFSGTNSLDFQTYMIDRGFNADQLAELSLLTRDKNYSFYQNRLMFPIYNKQRKIIAFGGRTLGRDKAKYINSGDTPLYNKSINLYGLAQALNSSNRNDPIIVVEGYIDVIKMHQSGFDKTVAPLGTALTAAQIKTIWNISSSPIICFDGDKAGYKAAGTIACNMLSLLRPGHSLQFATLPEGLDPDDYLKQKGKASLIEVLRNAIPLSRFVWSYIKSQYPDPIPEEKAKWYDDIEQKLATISHDVIRHEYTETFKSWGYIAHVPAPENIQGVARVTEPYREAISLPNQPYVSTYYAKKNMRVLPLKSRIGFNNGGVFQKLLLTLLLHYPELIDDVYEELCNINFHQMFYNQIRDILLNYVNECHDRQSQNVIQFIERRCGQNIPPDLMMSQNYIHLPRLQETPTLECAKEYWIKYYTKLNQPSHTDAQRALVDEIKHRLSQR